MIKRAEETDLLDVMYIYKSCVREMNSQGLFNWNTAYPGHEEVLSDIRHGNLFILKENHITIGVVCLNEEQPEEYYAMPWRYPGPWLVVHRLAVHPSCRNRNSGKKLMDFAEKTAAEKGCQSVRLDAITVNPPAMRLYEKCGYEKTGKIHFSYQRDWFMCMEKAVDAIQR